MEICTPNQPNPPSSKNRPNLTGGSGQVGFRELATHPYLTLLYE